MTQLPYPLTDFVIMHDFGDYEGMGNPSLAADVANYVSPFGSESDITNLQQFGFTLPQYKTIASTGSTRGVWGWAQSTDLMVAANYPNIPQPFTIVFTGKRRPFDGEGDPVSAFNQTSPIIDFTILSTVFFGLPRDAMFWDCGVRLIALAIPRDVTAGIRQFILVGDGANSAMYMDNVTMATGNAGTNGINSASSMIFNRSNSGGIGGVTGRWGEGGIGNTGFFHHIAIHDKALNADEREDVFIWHQARFADGGTLTI